MQYQITINGSGYHDHLIKADGTIVTNSGSKPVLTTHINIVGVAARPTSDQCFSLFALIMQLHRELNRPLVIGDMTWEEIAAGAK